jgi:hypothetical protein
MNLDYLTDISNQFEIHYTYFKETDATYWTVRLLGSQVIKAEGDTLEEAISNLSKQRELDEFKAKLAHAGLGNKSLEEWKDKLRMIL